MASAIGMDTIALNLDAMVEVDTGSTAAPTMLTDNYYSNTSGQTYSVNGGDISLLYTLSDSLLINGNSGKALGYLTNASASGNNYFLCDIEECNNSSKRVYLSGADYYSGEALPYSRSGQNMFSGYGHQLVSGRQSASSADFTSQIVNEEGVVLDSFSSTAWPFTITVYGQDITSYYLSGTTGITHEVDFKLLTASHGEYVVTLKHWDSVLNKFEDVPLKLNNGSEINSAFANGLMPVAISDPIIGNFETYYKVVLTELDTAKNASKLIWGEVVVENGEARFKADFKISNIPTPFSLIFGALPSSNPFFYGNGDFTFRGYHLDWDADEGTALTQNVNTASDKTFSSSIYKKSEGGIVAVNETDVGYKLFRLNTLKIEASQLNIDPYLDPSVNITLSTDYVDFFGSEVSCSLQTTNATVDNNDYIALSPTGLQVPIEWDSTTGEWKGAQSLTGTDSLSGSHDFAQFDLTADVTTGTWTMSCSGFGSDILGNKLSIAPTDITLNLDDQIHGGSGVISGGVDLSNHGDYSGVIVTITFENGRHIEVIPDENGDFSFDRLVEGEFEVHVFNEQYVAGCNTVQVTNANTNLPLNIVMVAGDINGDDAVDIGDYSYMSSMYGLTSADESFDAVADLNQDDVINVQDLSILGSHFGTDQCEAPVPQ